MTDALLLTSPQVALRLNCSVRTVHRMVDAGTLTPAQQLPGPNGAYLYRATDVDNFALQRTASVA